jgi:hypothetical protein
MMEKEEDKRRVKWKRRRKYCFYVTPIPVLYRTAPQSLHKNISLPHD